MRCAGCGSKSVTAILHSGGFSTSKALLGTAVFGPIGAVAGINGKKDYYTYKCSACGQELPHALDFSLESNIDMFLKAPTFFRDALRSTKATLYNIEWNEFSYTPSATGSVMPSPPTTQRQLFPYPIPTPNFSGNMVYWYSFLINLFAQNNVKLIDSKTEIFMDIAQDIGRMAHHCGAVFDAHPYYDASKLLFKDGYFVKRYINHTLYYSFSSVLPSPNYVQSEEFRQQQLKMEIEEDKYWICKYKESFPLVRRICIEKVIPKLEKLGRAVSRSLLSKIVEKELSQYNLPHSNYYLFDHAYTSYSYAFKILEKEGYLCQHSSKLQDEEDTYSIREKMEMEQRQEKITSLICDCAEIIIPKLVELKKDWYERGEVISIMIQEMASRAEIKEQKYGKVMYFLDSYDVHDLFRDLVEEGFLQSRPTLAKSNDPSEIFDYIYLYAPVL